MLFECWLFDRGFGRDPFNQMKLIKISVLSSKILLPRQRDVMTSLYKHNIMAFSGQVSVFHRKNENNLNQSIIQKTHSRVVPYRPWGYNTKRQIKASKALDKLRTSVKPLQKEALRAVGNDILSHVHYSGVSTHSFQISVLKQVRQQQSSRIFQF